MIKTQNLVAGVWQNNPQATPFQTVNPKTDKTLNTVFQEATNAQVEESVNKAAAIFDLYAETTLEQRIQFFQAIQKELKAIQPEILQTYQEESALPEGRSQGEFDRTLGQIQRFVELLQEGSFVQATIHTAGPDLRKMLHPIGPIGIFGASNFPLAFSTAAEELLEFLDQNEMVTVKDYFSTALEPHLGSYIPAETRNFFWITAHLDPKPLFSHFYHWFELERMEQEPHQNQIREKALLYNIFDSRNEGLATAAEEMFMHAGLYDKNPRAREIVYILIAQRAARGLGSLYAHANLMPMAEAGKIHSEYTPRGWMKTEKELLLFEQHLYLRQPGYGTSYITGKYLIEEMMMEVAKQNEANFSIKTFFDTLNRIGNIPVSLGRWEMTRDPSQLKAITNAYQPLD